MSVTVRAARPEDEPQWRGLWTGFLEYYELTLPEEVTATTWARVFDPSSRLSCRVAEEDGRLLGFALYHFHVATWSVKEDCYLEDLFVAPDARGRGIGRALIADLADVARAAGCGRLYWNTEASNTAARKLYDSFTPTDGHIRYRMTL